MTQFYLPPKWNEPYLRAFTPQPQSVTAEGRRGTDTQTRDLLLYRDH